MLRLRDAGTSQSGLGMEANRLMEGGLPPPLACATTPDSAATHLRHVHEA